MRLAPANGPQPGQTSSEREHPRFPPVRPLLRVAAIALAVMALNGCDASPVTPAPSPVIIPVAFIQKMAQCGLMFTPVAPAEGVVGPAVAIATVLREGGPPDANATMGTPIFGLVSAAGPFKCGPKIPNGGSDPRYVDGPGHVRAIWLVWLRYPPGSQESSWWSIDARTGEWIFGSHVHP